MKGGNVTWDEFSLDQLSSFGWIGLDFLRVLLKIANPERSFELSEKSRER